MKYLVERHLRDGAHLRRTRPRHHMYWRRMARDRVLLYGGVWAEGQGDTLIVQVDDVAVLRQVLGGDPYVHESLVVDVRTRQLGDEPSWHNAGPPERSSTAGPVTGAVTAIGTGPTRGLAAASAVRDRAAPPSPGDEALSAHESRISRMMLDGMTNRQMAACLGVSSRAVEQHITRIYRKLAISRRAQLAVALHGRPAA
ncbi:helix-turn-helix transcriptional regulator [Streptomyces sp. N2-109]|uniref:Helix-turn-helix transcriptional regulator n=1 Tax=Streptomyces gossypii TaxID=2883101 RepID=A0ABT2JXD5_9ACTN|nr:helix-turn-helix transcriptional regulator [Streptomyces gossypii]MCT2592558.1 helix-turn-helix transcriptional regulator [Streptomyces gossypii]